MLGRVQSAIDSGRNWLPPFRKRRSVYQQWAPSNGTDLRVLTAATTDSGFTIDKSNATISKSEVDIERESRPNLLDATAQYLENLTKTRVQKIFGDRFTGWRFGALHFGFWTIIVFGINFITTIWGLMARRSGVLLDGDCDRVEFLNTAVHVLINVLSTIVLSGSNYCMQCLSAPTRAEVDRAHASGKWLDVGIPSIRNVRHLSWKRIILWFVLALSSLPLHLFYNSAVFASLSSNDYFSFNVSESFLEDDTCRNCSAPVNQPVNAPFSIERMGTSYWQIYNTANVPRILDDMHKKYKRGLLVKLQPQECLNKYATSIVSNRRHVLLVASDDNFPTLEDNVFINGSHVYWAGPYYATDSKNPRDASNGYNWICSGMQYNSFCANDVDKLKANVSAWRTGHYCPTPTTPLGAFCAEARTFPVQYCLSEPAQPHCRLQFDTTIAVIVTVLNAVKAALMFYIACCVGDDPLITMGDAVASFLERADTTTKDMCLLSIRDVRKKVLESGPRPWVNVRSRWKDVASKKRRLTTLTLLLFTLATVGFLLGFGIYSLPDDTPRSLAFLASLGFGTVDPRTAISWIRKDLLSNVMLANTPQVILSMLYFSYNALFTSFLLSHEWISYAHKKKGLRVSADPVGAQRTDYFLQLPYRFGVPLMALSGLLHWLVSQSIFLVSIDFYDVFGSPTISYENEIGPVGSGLETQGDSMKTCGYSPIAIITVVIVGSFMVMGIVAFGYVPYKQGMTLAGNCSMAISAACHLDRRVDKSGVEAAQEKVQWGVVSVGEDGVGHCGFTTGSVTAPVDGELYAGTHG
ncbi:hypothetical protein HBI62_025840 [Parastagonospora nodorum]|nr:hypothetical protein HBI62_025840 [Parastagonospora nodorum]KAH6165672.1 hypothetical protein HBI63_028910 [Parastagonospora nodorum]KAH6188220.1 hypothetical protein HBI61_022950 [Parastagonospora nodorum]